MKLITTAQLAFRLSVGKKWVLAQAKSGRLPCVIVEGGQILFDADAVQEWLRSLAVIKKAR